MRTKVIFATVRGPGGPVARWSWEDTRAYSPSPPPGGGPASAWTRIVPEGVCSAGTGSLPSRNHFHAVW